MLRRQPRIGAAYVGFHPSGAEKHTCDVTFRKIDCSTSHDQTSGVQRAARRDFMSCVEKMKKAVAKNANTTLMTKLSSPKKSSELKGGYNLILAAGND